MFAARFVSRPLASVPAVAALAAYSAKERRPAQCGWFSSSPKVHLKYFEAAGVCETMRLVMAVGGISWTESKWKVDMAKIDFSNIEATLPLASPEFGTARAAGELDANLGRAPVVIIDGKHTLAQSKTAERYLSRRLGLMGATDIEAAHIDAITEHVRDIKEKYTKAKADKEKDAAIAKFFSETMPDLMAKLEKSVGAGGPALVGSKLSLADITLFVFITQFFDDKNSASASISKCPRLQTSVKAVTEHPAIVKYLETSKK